MKYCGHTELDPHLPAAVHVQVANVLCTDNETQVSNHQLNRLGVS